jgi:diguanylate cyclase (GGDEF)-like protein
MDLVTIAVTVVAAAGVAAALTVHARRRALRAERALERSERARRRLASELDSLTQLFTEGAARRAVPTATKPDELEVEAFDAVSGLLRERFVAVLIQQRVAAARRQLHPVAVIAMELDGLRGATPGNIDAAMRALGAVVRESLREADCACRVGDVIVIIALDNTTEAGARSATERIQAGLRSVSGYTVSAGIASYPIHALEAPDLVGRAGDALLAARANGRSRVTTAEIAQ